MSTRSSWIWIAILALTACTTDVVEFPPRSSSDAMADSVAWSCTKTEISGERCSTCKPPWPGDVITTCEDLYCKFIYADSGKDKSGCKTCAWSDHPQDKCKICWKGSITYFDSCHAKKDAGP